MEIVRIEVKSDYNVSRGGWAWEGNFVYLSVVIDKNDKCKKR